MFSKRVSVEQLLQSKDGYTGERLQLCTSFGVRAHRYLLTDTTASLHKFVSATQPRQPANGS
jgi:hypothetical protein